MKLRARVRCWRCWVLFYKWHYLCHVAKSVPTFSSVHPGREGRVLWEPNGNLGIRNNDNEILPTHLQVSREQLTGKRKKCIFRSCLGGERIFLGGRRAEEIGRRNCFPWYCNTSEIFESKHTEMGLCISLASGKWKASSLKTWIGQLNRPHFW